MFESLAGKLNGRRGVDRPLVKRRNFNHENGNKISSFYINVRSIRNRYIELKSL